MDIYIHICRWISQQSSTILNGEKKVGYSLKCSGWMAGLAINTQGLSQWFNFVERDTTKQLGMTCIYIYIYIYTFIPCPHTKHPGKKYAMALWERATWLEDHRSTDGSRSSWSRSSFSGSLWINRQLIRHYISSHMIYSIHTM